jgi:hypothetical protein
MSINPAEGKSAVVVFGASKTATAPSVSCSTGTLSAQHEYCYLGIVFRSDLSWGRAYACRAEEAQTRATHLARFCRQQAMYSVSIAATMVNTCVLQSILWGSILWLPSFLSSWDWLVNNPIQALHCRTLKDILHLPASTSHLVLQLETGVYPAMFYALKRLLKFTARLPLAASPTLAHLYALNVPGGMRACLNAVLSPVVCPEQVGFHKHLRSLHEHFLYLVEQRRHDPRDPACPNRVESSYLAWVWNGSLHRRSVFFSLYLPPREQLRVFRARLGHANLPVETLRCFAFPDRVCPCCGHESNVCDMFHALLECPYSAHARSWHNILPGASMRDLFTSSQPSDHSYIAYVLSLFHAFIGS